MIDRNTNRPKRKVDTLTNPKKKKEERRKKKRMKLLCCVLVVAVLALLLVPALAEKEEGGGGGGKDHDQKKNFVMETVTAMVQAVDKGDFENAWALIYGTIEEQQQHKANLPFQDEVVRPFSSQLWSSLSVYLGVSRCLYPALFVFQPNLPCPLASDVPASGRESPGSPPSPLSRKRRNPDAHPQSKRYSTPPPPSTHKHAQPSYRFHLLMTHLCVSLASLLVRLTPSQHDKVSSLHST